MYFALLGKPKFIRQIIITGHGKSKPALIITNDFEMPHRIKEEKRFTANH
jgi:hypothetical protein